MSSDKVLIEKVTFKEFSGTKQISLLSFLFYFTLLFSFILLSRRERLSPSFNYHVTNSPAQFQIDLVCERFDLEKYETTFLKKD